MVCGGLLLLLTSVLLSVSFHSVWVPPSFRLSKETSGDHAGVLCTRKSSGCNEITLHPRAKRWAALTMFV